MAMVVELRNGDGSLVRRIPDPSGGTFDAAGDFDRLLDDDSYPTLSQVSTNGRTELGIPAMPNLLEDIRQPWRRRGRAPRPVASCGFSA